MNDLLRRPFPLLASLVLVFAAAFSQDPILPYLDGKAPEIVQELPPSVTPPEGVSVREVLFTTAPGCVIYALIATPTWGEKHPGMLVVHGGGGSAEKDKAIAWAQRGYIAVAPDLPSIGQPEKISNSVGPWTGKKYGADRYLASPSVTNSLIFHAVLAGVKAFDLLAAQKGLETDKVGIVGVSWGGYMTTMLSGLLGSRVRAAFAVYGCGFYDFNSQAPALAKMPDAERAEWLRWLDAGRRAPGVKASFFTAAAANDFFFWPLSVQATQDAMGTGDKNLVYAANANHKIPLPGGTLPNVEEGKPFVPTAFQPYPTPTGGKGNWLAMEVPWFERHLKGLGKVFPVVRDFVVKETGEFSFKVSGETRITNASVWFSPADSDWKNRAWKELRVELAEGGSYQGAIPVPSAGGLDCFVVVSDDTPVSVSSHFVTLGKRLSAGSASAPAFALWPNGWVVKENGKLGVDPKAEGPRKNARSWSMDFEKFPFCWLQRNAIPAGSIRPEAHSGLKFWARAEGAVALEARIDSLDVQGKPASFAAPFEGKADWTEVSLPFSAFKGPRGLLTEVALRSANAVVIVAKKRDAAQAVVFVDDLALSPK